MADNSNFDTTVEALFKGMDGVVSSKTVAQSDAITIGDVILLPLVDVQFGLGAGFIQGKPEDNSAGGMGGKMTPCAVLVIQGGDARSLSISKHQDHNDEDSGWFRM